MNMHHHMPLYSLHKFIVCLPFIFSAIAVNNVKNGAPPPAW